MGYRSMNHVQYSTDDFAIQFDQENSDVEDRFLMLGMSNETNILIVCHCERDNGNTIRIISSRKATNRNIIVEDINNER